MPSALQAQARTESRLAIDAKEMEDRSAEDAGERAEKRLQEWRAIDRFAVGIPSHGDAEWGVVTSDLSWYCG